MLLTSILAVVAAVPSPIDLIRRAHTTGTVITKCSKPGVLDLAFDDGPYTCELIVSSIPWYDANSSCSEIPPH
jgi:hypothetical protein